MRPSRLRRRGWLSADRPERAPPQRLSPDALAWLARNLAAGVDEAGLVESLVGAGVPAEVARLGLRELLASGLGRAYFEALLRGDRATELVALLDGLRCHAPALPTIEGHPSAEVFYDLHWASCTPLVLRRYVPSWPRPLHWSFDDLRARFGEREIEVTSGREGRADPDVDFAELRTTTSFGALVDRALSEVGNDVYVVARNRVLERALPELLDELEPPAHLFDPALRHHGVSLWLGPRGTRTKLHHDGTNNLFTQVLGTKRLRLVPPTVLELATNALGYYARTDALEVERAHPGHCFEVVLEPGDAVFLPVGWWHEVESLSPSLSLAMVGFPRANEYAYLPGRRRWLRPS